MHVAFLAWTGGGIEMGGGVLFESLWECDFYKERLLLSEFFCKVLLEHRVCEFGCLVGYFIRSDGCCICEGLQNLGAGSVRRRVYEL